LPDRAAFIPTVTLADMAGVDEAKAELAGLVAFLKDPPAYGRLGARVPRGVLLIGPSGTGKTLLAEAVAGEAKVPFLAFSGAECLELLAARDSLRVQDLFAWVGKSAPAVLFIDGLDMLAHARGAEGHVFDQLLTALDAIDLRPGIVLLAATSRPELLNPDLLRSGRFERQVLLQPPDKDARVAILSLHLKRIKAAPDIDVEQVAGLTPGLTAADLACVLNEAALVATRRGAALVEWVDVKEGLGRVLAGLGPKVRVLTQDERRILAYHAMGRALVTMSVNCADPIRRVSLIPSGIAGMGSDYSADLHLLSREAVQARMTVLLAGRAAERVAFDSVSTTGADDLQRATYLARAMVAHYGMNDELVPVTFDWAPDRGEAGRETTNTYPAPPYSHALAQTLDRLVQEQMKRALDEACFILKRRRAVLDTGARLLLEKETLTAETVQALAAEETAAIA
jgi:cell division protease FtsH